MKANFVSAILLIFPLLLVSCQKEDGTDPEPRTFVEEAFPDIQGEKKDFIINGQTVTVEEFDGIYVFQGDMILTEAQLTTGSMKGAGLGKTGQFAVIRPWSCGKVFYSINPSLEFKSTQIKSAIKNFEEKTSLKFVEWTGEQNHVEFVSSEGAGGIASNCGMIGGHQLIWLSDAAPTSSIIHEIGHTVGLVHEHSRDDRDKYVRILEENIIPGEEHNFKKFFNQYSTDNFDFNSIMLYPSDAFSRNGRATITKLDGTNFTVSANELQEGDLEIINKIYQERKGTVEDIDGNIYRTVLIGDQLWMAENLRTTKYNDGTPINSGNPWNPNYKDGTYWWYDNNIKYKDDYGALYDHYAVMKNPCPIGWHVAFDAEWTELTDYLGGESVAGGKLKEAGTQHWWSPNTGATDEVCFTALPGGAHWDDGTFIGINGLGYWWCFDYYLQPFGFLIPVYRALESDDFFIIRSYANDNYGFAVRCIKNN